MPVPSGHQQTFDTASAQQHVQISADKGAVTMFRHDHLARSRF